MMKRAFFLASLATAIMLGAPATAAPPAVAIEQTAPDAEKRRTEAVTQALTKIFAAKPLTSEQEARLPVAREVVGTMTPPGFYARLMSEMMGSMLTPLTEMVGGPMAAGELVERQVGVPQEDLPELSEVQRAEIIALLDPAAKERAAALMTSMTGSFTEMFARFEAPFRDGFAKAFAVRFSDAELRAIRAFFATPAGSSFARQSFAVYADPQVMSASMSIVPALLKTCRRCSSVSSSRSYICPRNAAMPTSRRRNADVLPPCSA